MAFNPKMLILARESRRMTQKALADASGIKQASISRAEAGLHEPQPLTIAAWAKASRYPETFFAHQMDAPPLPRTFWRKQAKLSKTDQKEIEARIAIRCLNIQTLVRSVELPEPDAPSFKLGIDGRNATEVARHLRARWRVPSGPIEDLTALAETNGIMVVMLPSSVGFQGVSIRDGRKDLPPVVFISADDPADRQRWTIAHEIGHVVLHHLRSNFDQTEDEIEDEADEFASEFLMPAAEIRHQFHWRTDLSDLAQLKLHWRTSMAALLRRAKKLERISPAQGLRLIKMMSAAGYRRVEPNEFAPEIPTMLSELVRVHLEDLGFNESELAAALALELEDLRSVFLDQAPSTIPVEDSAKIEGRPKPRLRLVE